jgi:cyclopropane-fatty-acyl-phospholipid synthase
MGALAKKIVTNLFSRAGITIGGNKHWDIRVNNDRFYPSTLRGSLGFGESYMKGDWEVESIDALFRRIIRMDIPRSSLVTLNRLYLDIKSRLTNLQTRIGSLAIAETHYDLDHRLYELFLGPYNQYTCCFFNQAQSLEEAEVEKLELITQPKPGAAGSQASVFQKNRSLMRANIRKDFRSKSSIAITGIFPAGSVVGISTRP